VNLKVRYTVPFKAIFLDLDGTLTGMGANSWATPYWKHNHWDGVCETDEMFYAANEWSSETSGLICPPEVQVRRIEFNNYSPWELYMQGLYIAQWEDDQVADLTAQSLEEDSSVDMYSWYDSLFPFVKSGWVVPFVTGRKYRIYWSAYATDHESMKVNVGSQWLEDDDSIYFVTPYSDVRAEFPVFDSSGSRIPYDGINTDDSSLWETGHNTYEKEEEVEEDVESETDDTADTEEVVEDTEDVEETEILKEFHFIVNGKNMSEKSNITMQGWRCADNICPNEFGLKECAEETRNWSDPASWSSGVVPVEGDYVEVETGWNMIYDIEGDSPLFDMVKVMGCLTFY
jgi:hypothetical protein